MPKTFYKLLQLDITQIETVYYSIDIRRKLIEFILLSGKNDLIQVSVVSYHYFFRLGRPES